MRTIRWCLKDTVAISIWSRWAARTTRAGRNCARFAFTGPSYSNLPAIMAEAAKAEGVTVYRRKDADDFFDRSDNYAFAQFGIVSHTVGSGF